MVGESLVGEGNEVAHIDLLIGSKGGPVGEAFAAALTNQKAGAHEPPRGGRAEPAGEARHDHVQQGHAQGRDAGRCRCSGRRRRRVARAVVDSVREGVIPEADVEDLCVVVGVFIHWEAADDKKIFD